MKRDLPIAFDWGAMIDQLLQRGLTGADINGGVLTNKMLSHYRRGVQPLHWRGERIISLWCVSFAKMRDDAPTCVVERGHRVDRRLDRRLVPGPRLQALPVWPKFAPQSVKPIKGRKK